MRDEISYRNTMQKHIIKKLTFSLHSHSGAQVRQLEHDVINIYRKQIEQLLDEHFSKLSGSDVEYHIAELELDLGRIKPENLRTEMPRRISEQLSNYLNSSLVRTCDVISGQEKQLSLFSHFLETGRAPWWTERFHRKTLGQLVEKLCINSPTEIKGLLLHVIKDERKIRRLINQLPDQCLYGISQLYLSAHDVVSVARQYSDIVALFTELDREKAVREIYAPMQLSAGYANHSRIKLRGYYWQNALISIAYGPANAFSCDQLLLDTLVSLTSNNDEAYCSLVTGLSNAVGLLKDDGYKFSSRLPGLIAEFATEIANLPEKTVPSPGGSEPDEFMGLTDQVIAINVLSSKKRAISERALSGAARQVILRDLARRENAGARRDLVTGLSTKRNSPSSRKRVISERALTGAARQTILRDLARREKAGAKRGLVREPSTKRDSSSSRKRIISKRALTDAARQTILRDLVRRRNAGARRGLIKGPSTKRDSPSSRKWIISESVLSGAAERTILWDLILREKAGARRGLVTGSSTKGDSSSSRKRVISKRALTGAARQMILRDLARREKAGARHGLVREPSTKRDASSSGKRVISERVLSGAARQAILRDLARREKAGIRHSLVRESSTKRDSSSSGKRVISERVLSGAARQAILRDLARREKAGIRHSLVRESSTKRDSSSSGKRVISERVLSGAARQAILRDLARREKAGIRHSLVRESSTKRNSTSSGKRVISESALTGTPRQKILQNSGVQERAVIQSETIRDPFTDSNEDYIYNAGLVIVWPYLPRLFSNLGMVENDNFIDMDAAERAALLLQYLVEPDTEIPESLLSLNKLLCGFELSWPLPADFTPTEQEQSECDALLKAVTCHWDVLKNMSFERIRLDFLQRQGVLRARAGNWLLQVEQQTLDILMQKLPWPIGVVKLPWMDCALLVDWG